MAIPFTPTENVLPFIIKYTDVFKMKGLKCISSYKC